jgi:DNA-binding HxlR family transcriptional regulator
MATNVLTDCLVVLELQGLLTKAVAADKKAKFTYRLAEQGVRLSRLLLSSCCGKLRIAASSSTLACRKSSTLGKTQPLKSTNGSLAKKP